MRAKFYQKTGDRIQCILCPHLCTMKEGQTGICGVRRAENGELHVLNYGDTIAIHIDPIEKKPLYHFHPGSDILSIGTSGCNFRCSFCQNSTISQSITRGRDLDVASLVKAAQGTVGIAYTYTEPTIWYEFVFDAARAAHEQGLKNVLVTNGFMNKEPLLELLPYIDAMNIDLKAMDDGFYRKFCNGRLEPVLETIITASAVTHVEVTCLLITDLNDSPEQVRQLSQFLQSVDDAIPLHISRYHPAFRMTRPPTPVERVEKAIAVAREYLKYVYAGNIAIPGGTDTYCPNCGNILIERSFYSTSITGIVHRKCGQCGRAFDGVL